VSGQQTSHVIAGCYTKTVVQANAVSILSTQYLAFLSAWTPVFNGATAVKGSEWKWVFADAKQKTPASAGVFHFVLNAQTAQSG
jgi:hypothetical protein